MALPDPRLNKNRVPSTGQVELLAGTTSTAVSNLAVGVQSRSIHQPKNAAAWALYNDQTVPTTPILYTVDVRTFTLTHPAAVGGEIIEYIVIASDLA